MAEDKLFGFDTLQKKNLERYVAEAVAGGEAGAVTSVNGVDPVAGEVTLTATDLGATAVGEGVFQAVDATTARTVLGAGTSNLALGTTGTTALAGNTAIPAASSTAPAALAAAAAVGVGTTFARADHVHAIPGVSAGAVRGTVLIQAAEADLAGGADLPTTVAKVNAILAKLRTAGILSP